MEGSPFDLTCERRGGQPAGGARGGGAESSDSRRKETQGHKCQNTEVAGPDRVGRDDRGDGLGAGLDVVEGGVVGSAPVVLGNEVPVVIVGRGARE